MAAETNTKIFVAGVPTSKIFILAIANKSLAPTRPATAL